MYSVSKSLDLMKITCISSLRSCDKLLGIMFVNNNNNNNTQAYQPTADYFPPASRPVRSPGEFRGDVRTSRREQDYCYK